MSEVVSVICMSDGVRDATRVAAAALSASQRHFVFQVEPDVVALPPPDLKRGGYSWPLLHDVLLREKRRLRARYLFGIMDRPNVSNWFSATHHDGRVSFITTADWDYLCQLPVAAFVAFELVENLSEMLLGFSPNHEETRGCLYDLCGHKPHISYKLRTGDICWECRDLLRSKLAPELTDVLVAMLEEVRRVALGRVRGEQPGRDPSPVGRIDSEFPFPIAYCFRSMQGELAYSRKWLKMLELYEVTVKYLTFVLLSDFQARGGRPAPPGCDLASLRRPSAGQWHACCFSLIRAARGAADELFIAPYLRPLDSKAVGRAQAASEKFVPLRNETKGHGFVEEEPAYRQYYEENRAGLQALLDFVAPLARYRLLKVGDGLRRRQGVSRFPAKVLMGSHPLFPVEEHETKEEVDTDCLLYSPDTGKYLSLYPWVSLEACPECLQERVFLYDKVSENEVTIREYPTNHAQKKKDGLPEQVMARLRPA
jgi:hypothetical protein